MKTHMTKQELIERIKRGEKLYCLLSTELLDYNT